MSSTRSAFHINPSDYTEGVPGRFTFQLNARQLDGTGVECTVVEVSIKGPGINHALTLFIKRDDAWVLEIAEPAPQRESVIYYDGGSK